MDVEKMIEDLRGLLKQYGEKIPYGELVGAPWPYSRAGDLVWQDPEPYFIEQAATALSTFQAENAEMQKQLNEFSEFLCHITGGLLSKTNYTAQVMISAAEDYLEDLTDVKNGPWGNVRKNMTSTNLLARRRRTDHWAIANHLPVQLDNGAFLPVREHSTDGGLDLKSPVDCYIQPGDSAAIDTGVHVQLPPNTTGEVVCKSGLNVNHGLICSGLVDEGYTGSIVVKLYNLGKEPYYIKAGDKIAQLVIRPVLYLTPAQVDKIEGGERGDNGFGSTGR